MSIYINPYSEQYDYEHSRLQYIGAREMVNTAKEEGLLKGIEQGLQQGLQQGLAAAEAEKVQTILKLYKIGIAIADIAAATNKTEADIQNIVANHK